VQRNGASAERNDARVVQARILAVPMEPRALARTTALVQGTYYLTTGVWPLVSMRSFEAVTGPKTDRWLVKTVGGLVGVVGAALLAATARHRAPGPELAGVAAGMAATLAVVDVVYVSKRRISPVYLLDAVAGAALIAGWALSARRA
jgi:hypothetical protein